MITKQKGRVIAAASLYWLAFCGLCVYSQQNPGFVQKVSWAEQWPAVLGQCAIMGLEAGIVTALWLRGHRRTAAFGLATVVGLEGVLRAVDQPTFYYVNTLFCALALGVAVTMTYARTTRPRVDEPRP